MERRSKALGMGFYSACTIKPSWAQKNSGENSLPGNGSLSGGSGGRSTVFLEVNYREHHSRYSRGKQMHSFYIV